MSGVDHKTVTDDEEGMRLDRWFKAHYPAVRHGDLEKFLRKGQVRVDGGRSKANRRLEAGQEVRIPPLSDSAARQRPAPSVKKEDAAYLHRATIFEDDELLVLNKPFGIAVQGGAKTKRHIDGMLDAVAKNGERPRLVHRLDRDTGGVFVLAKTRKAATRLSEALLRRRVEKDYWALVKGVPHPLEGTISLPITKRRVDEGDKQLEKMGADDRSDAKPAITEFQTLDVAGQAASFLYLRPITGRTHQLRVHCEALGCPIIGDGKYGGKDAALEGVSKKLHLFCRAMRFPHPATGQLITITAPLTEHMAETWKFFGFDKDATYEWPMDL